MSKPPSKSVPQGYEEERIPFDLVMRKLANSKPPHKTAKPVVSKEIETKRA